MQTLPRPLSKPGPLLRYVELLSRSGTKPAEINAMLATFKDLLRSDAGKLLLNFIEISTSYPLCDPAGDPRALAEKEAARFIAADLTRIASDEYEKISARLASPR